ncbi:MULTISPECIES: hypothetical protein [Stenotrophomonas]|jgi:hypothetical protein|uniref:hypothetical protein n=1 Tax=Stenotrophomonas TaxID=40323 RepID=UPI0021C879CE|nr:MULTISPECIES: hypothetical protein [Stenotrophomonas]
MPRKKQLKVRGSTITSYDVAVKRIKSEHTDSSIEVIKLQIEADQVIYEYQLHKDENFSDLKMARDAIDASLKKAREDFLNVEISEYPERSYLTLKVQGESSKQFTGDRK